MCTPASTALFACPGRVSGTDCVQVRYRHIRQAAIPARVVLGTARVFFFRPGNFTSSTIQLTNFVGYS